MSEITRQTGALSEPPLGWQQPNGTTTLRASSRIATFLTVSVVLFVVITTGFIFWITGEHNRLAASASEQMIRGGIGAVEEQLKTVQMDFAIWPDGVEAFARNDRAWIAENFGLSVTAAGTADLMMVWHTDGSPPYGWVADMDHTQPSETLIPAEAIASMRALLDEVDKSERVPVVDLFAIDGAVWMLSSARLVQEDPEADPADDADIPRLIFGSRIDDAMLGELGQAYLIDDLSLALDESGAPAGIALKNRSGDVVGNAVWSPPRPGAEILRRIALPLALGLGLLTLIAFVSSNLLSRSARRLETTMLAAQSASRAKTDFIANISHELRTPMNGILGLAILLQQTRMDDHQAKMMRMLQSSAETQMNLIGDLLEISSIENGHLSLTMAPFTPAAIVQSVSSMFEMEATEKGLDLGCDVTSAQGVRVIGDKERYRQICTNIISNAVKFTSEGSVQVRLHTRSRLDEVIVTLEVSDTGPGIDPADHGQIFERFSQGRSRQTGKAPGTGLGLSITKTITELMGGRISVASRAGEGASFTVEIPFEPASANQTIENA